MSAPADSVTDTAVFACAVTGTDGYRHKVADDEYRSTRIAGGPFRTLCRLDIEPGPVTVLGAPCEWCGTIADHAELADPFHLGDDRVDRFLASLRSQR